MSSCHVLQYPPGLWSGFLTNQNSGLVVQSSLLEGNPLFRVNSDVENGELRQTDLGKMSRLGILRGLEIIQYLISSQTTDSRLDKDNVSYVLITAHTEVAFGLVLPVEADEIQQKAAAKQHSQS